MSVRKHSGFPKGRDALVENSSFLCKFSHSRSISESNVDNQQHGRIRTATASSARFAAITEIPLKLRQSRQAHRQFRCTRANRQLANRSRLHLERIDANASGGSESSLTAFGTNPLCPTTSPALPRCGAVH